MCTQKRKNGCYQNLKEKIKDPLGKGNTRKKANVVMVKRRTWDLLS